MSNFRKVRISLTFSLNTCLENLISVYSAFLETLDAQLMASVKKLRQYLGDKSTQLTLMRIARGTILSQCNDFLDIVKHSPHAPISEIESEVEIATKVDLILTS